MLRFFDAPHWAAADGNTPAVPAVLPGCLLLFLAAQGDGAGAWVEREKLVTLFWPDRPAAEGQRNLRVNLHRLRAVLAGWGQGEALASERTRVKLALPTDLQRLAAALATADAPALLAAPPPAWLQGFRIAGFEPFWAWASQEQARWQAAWLAAAERALLGTLARDEAALALALFAAWQEAGGQALPALQALDPGTLPLAAQATRLHLCARLPQAAPRADLASASVVPTQRELPGRAAEQDALRAGAAAALVVLGEPGVGKTALLAACWPAAPMLHGREGLEGVPFAPVLEWLRAQAASLPRWLTDPAAQLGPYRLDLARLLPEIAPDEPLPPLDAHTAKARLLEVLARLFEARGPVLLVDDLQWCDAATLEWLVFLAHRGRQRWRASARRHELAGPARQALASLGAARLLQELPLEVLDRAALAAACRQRWPQRDWPEPVLDGLHQASAGNPFVLGELVAMGAERSLAAGQAPALPRRVRDLLARRLQTLGASARAAVEAAAVLGQPAPPGLLLALCDGQDEAAMWRGCEEALEAGLLADTGHGLQCRHDLIRSAAAAGLGAARRQWLHRRAALALGALREAEPLAVAAHWEAAQEPQTALAWLHRGAQQQKERGRFDEAQALWQRVADESLDATQALRARLALAECALFHDLAAGRAALEGVLDQLGAVADLAQRDPIEGQALAGLIDNAVFSGDLPCAVALAPRLRELLPRLRTDERVHACEVLIELAMREPDIDAGWAQLAQVQRLAPGRPSTLSFEAQLHWFGGNPRAARDAFEALLAAHPDYCSGLTIENDLAVMLQALGETARAEEMARRSLASWQGVPHTETLSLLVLGSVLTTAGRHDEAEATLARALQLGRDQASVLFEAEALVRRARLRLQCGDLERAQADLDAAEPLLRGSGEPLRASAYAVARASLQAARGEAPDAALADRLRSIGLRSLHPLLHARLARIEALQAAAEGDAPRALLAARRQAEIARAAGLLEPLADALLLQAAGEPDPLPCLHEAAALAEAQGFADLAWRAQAWLAAVTREPRHQAAARLTRQRLEGAARPRLFDARLAMAVAPRIAPPA